MIRFPSLLSAVLALFLLVGCGSEVVLTGTVKDTYTQKPIREVNITIGEVSLKTDAQGKYRTPQWKAEDKLQAKAPGYATKSIGLEKFAKERQASVPATVTLNLDLRPNTLKGLVTDAYTEEPLAGVQIVAKQPNLPLTATSILSSTTDKEGKYTLENVPEKFALSLSLLDYEASEVNLRRKTVYNAALRPATLSGLITNRYNDAPIANATVQVLSTTTKTDKKGFYRLENVPEDAKVVKIEADGFAPLTQELEKSAKLDADLRPDTLKGTLKDMVSGKPISFATIIATQKLTSTAVGFVRIDGQATGQFTLTGLPEGGFVQVLAPGYRKAVIEVKAGSALTNEIKLKPFVAKALYAKTSVVAYFPKKLREFLDQIDRTELNALVVDLKSDNMVDLGLIYYQSNVPLIKELKTSKDLMDVKALLAETRKRDIYTIARIHIFAHDNLLAETKPEWAAQNLRGCKPNANRRCNGKIFYADWDIAWLDPWNRNVWDYNIQLGVEAAQLGFDEVQFDYIRFPNDAKDIEALQLSKSVDYKTNPQPLYENIATFMAQAHDTINKVGAFFSVDVFGYASWTPQANIGQNMQLMAEHADYICPMVYPSHYDLHELGFTNSAAHPFEIVSESLRRGQKMVMNKRARQRPWLQDFTLIWMPKPLIVRYGVPEVRAQIDATDSYKGNAGWALWNSDNEYTFAALKPAPARP